MALPDYINLVNGTAKVWQSSGVDYLLTLTSLANNAAREGGKGDLHDGTFGFPELLEIFFITKLAVAPSNGNQIELYIGESDSPTAAINNVGGLTGADAAVTNPDERKLLCNLVGGINLSNAIGTGVQAQRFVYYPVNRYIIPLVVNKSGQALSGTAGDHVITVTPWFRSVTE